MTILKRLVAILFSLGALANAASRTQIYSALQAGGVLNPDRELVHFSNTCVLHIDGGNYPVIDVQELVKSDATPRGVNQIVILNPQLRPVREIEYTTERPLFCVDNRLYVFGDLEIDSVLPEGNVLTFTNRGKTITVGHVEASQYPIPITKDRTARPQ